MKRVLIICAVAAIMATAVLLLNEEPDVPALSIRLVVTGPEGQPFSGSYVVDGATYATNAIVPADIHVQGRNVT